MVRVKRVYEKAEAADGFRVLVDRLWPRGLKRERAKVDLWMKDVAPSDALRKSFHHDAMKWPDFEKEYESELKKKKEWLAELRNSRKSTERLPSCSARKTRSTTKPSSWPEN